MTRAQIDCPAPRQPVDIGFTHARGWSWRSSYLFAIAFYMLLVIYGSLLPLQYRPLAFSDALHRFKEILDDPAGPGSRSDWRLNFVLLGPLGFVATWWAAARCSRLLRLMCVAALATSCCAAFSICVEFMQLWFPPRISSKSDVLANTLGASVGALAAIIASLLRPHLNRWLTRLGPHPIAARWGVFYLLGLLFWSVLPLDLVLSADPLAAKIREGKVCLIPFRDAPLEAVSLMKLVLHALAFAPIGYWLAGGGAGRGRGAIRAPLVWAVMGGATIATLIELMQLFVASRQSSTTAVATAIMGATMAALVRLRSHSPNLPDCRRSCQLTGPQRSLWLAGSIVYSIAVVLMMLAPFHLVDVPAERAARWAGLRQLPFVSMLLLNDFTMLTNALHKGIPFAALGAGLYKSAERFDLARGISWFATMAIISFAAMLGLLIELGQVYVGSHQPDTTDVLIYIVGAATGVCGMQRLHAYRTQAVQCHDELGASQTSGG